MDSKISRRFLQLTAGEKQAFLAGAIHELPISARAHYEDGDDMRDERLRRINEMIHVASGKLHALQLESHFQYPDETLIDVLFGRAGTLCAADLTWALEHALPRAEV
jgi:hypothetical protein